jgi:hypothetical protein
VQAIRFKAQILTFVLWTALMALAEPTDPKLFGTWTQEGGQATVWTFRPDGSGFMEQSNPRTTARFTWSCRGQRLSVCTAGLTIPYTVVSNDGSSLVIRNEQLSSVYKLKKKEG